MELVSIYGESDAKLFSKHNFVLSLFWLIRRSEDLLREPIEPLVVTGRTSTLASPFD